ncbi:thiosulfate oxidation carrier complex protein SoxZ [Paramagnetospirillum kuznetsovii]|uniref:Thiosulfate oxidation carrier complex protein SoxZ n=1 Tax=Paramagnetospirillum kuznetsovii TaxID=2053833 RepID=A0A364NUU7_9PROT|nr:thiosulfate oxidation carrier complex protein SoxZ [Paramagnetospirillum kuznetsovii]RAU20859.1 thiosulfate oxidation carrier complex protein SoxZ [Paramagnetospirillum kuznetsovii]
MPTPKVKFNETAAKGEILEIKTMIDHDMESGQRKDKDGKLIPRKIVNKFICTLNGKELFHAEMHGAVSANPATNFFITATESGTMEFKWFDDDGSVYAISRQLTVN